MSCRLPALRQTLKLWLGNWATLKHYHYSLYYWFSTVLVQGRAKRIICVKTAGKYHVWHIYMFFSPRLTFKPIWSSKMTPSSIYWDASKSTGQTHPGSVQLWISQHVFLTPGPTGISKSKHWLVPWQRRHITPHSSVSVNGSLPSRLYN